MRITSFEEVSFSGWFGLVLAVQQQPVVVMVDASAPSFLNFKVGSVKMTFVFYRHSWKILT